MGLPQLLAGSGLLGQCNYTPVDDVECDGSVSVQASACTGIYLESLYCFEETLLSTVNKQLLAKQKLMLWNMLGLVVVLSMMFNPWKKTRNKVILCRSNTESLFWLFLLFWLYLPRIEPMFCGCRADIFPCVGDFNREQLASVTLNVMFSSNWQRIKLISVLNGFEVQYKYCCFVAPTL